MRIAIVGPGAVGTLLAYHLHLAGIRPTVVYRREAYREAILKQGGLLLEKDGENHLIPVDHYMDGEASEAAYDVVIIAVKSYDTREAAEEAARLVTRNGLVVSVQNGLGNLDVIKEALSSRATAVQGVLSYGATLLRPGYARYGGCGRVVLSAEAADLGEALEKGGMRVKLVEDTTPYVWEKLLINAGINPVTALTRAPNRVIIEDPDARDLAVKAVLEGKAVAEKLGVKLPHDPVESMLRVAKLTGSNYSSMLQDILRGRRTEVDWINGAIVKLGSKLGVPTPVNEALTMLVRCLEKWSNERR